MSASLTLTPDEKPLNVTKAALLYEGKAKRLYATNHQDVLWVEYKDDATALNGQKRETLAGKGILNNEISSWFFSYLTDQGIAHHFLKRISATEQLVRPVTIIPLEVVVRPLAAGSICRRLGLEEGTALSPVVVEWYYKDDQLGDPLVNEDHIRLLDLASPEQLAAMRSQALQVQRLLEQALAPRSITLVDFKLEFGVDAQGQVLLADEISPDTCRFWDTHSGRKMDKDRFRQDLGDTLTGYQEIWQRLKGSADMSNAEQHYLAKVYVTLKESVLDPQGQAVKESLHSLQYDSIQDVRIGKYMELQVAAANSQAAAEAVDEVCAKLLANPVIEKYRYEIEEASA